MQYNLEGQQRDIIRRLLREDIKEKQSEELDQVGEHVLQAEIDLYRQFGGEADL